MLSTDANPRGNHEQINVHGRIDSAASSTVDRRLGYEFDDDGPIKATDEIVPPPIHTHFLSSHTTATPQLSQPLQPSLHPSRPQVKRLLYLGLARPVRGNLLVDEDADEEEGQSADDTEDEDDTGLPGGPILAFDEFVYGVLTAGEEGGVDCGHFALPGRKDSTKREAG